MMFGLALLAVLALVATACGGSSDSGGEGATETSTTEGSSPAANESSSTETGASDAIVEEAEKNVEESMKEPETWEGPSEPVKATKNISVATIACDYRLLGCVESLEPIKGIGKELGWKVKAFDGKSDPSVWNKDIQAALTEGAEIIFTASLNPQLIQEGLAAAKAKNVPVINNSAGGSTPNEVIEPPAGKPWTDVDVSPDYGKEGKVLADWIIADSQGKGNVLMVEDPEYVSVQAHEKAAHAELQKCSGCTVEKMNITGATVATTVPNQVVAYFQSHPEAEYLYAPYDPMLAAAIPAIQQAGLSDRVKAVGILANAQNLEYIAGDQVQQADVAYDTNYVGWAQVDQGLRVLAGQPLSEPNGENVPEFLVTKENLPEEGWKAPFEYEAEYKKLWGIK